MCMKISGDGPVSVRLWFIDPGVSLRGVDRLSRTGVWWEFGHVRALAHDS
jgi:hypothetical protein